MTLDMCNSNYDPNCNGSHDYRNLAQEVIGKEKGQEPAAAPQVPETPAT